MNNYKNLFILLTSLAVVACTKQNFYDAMQQNRIQECQNQAPPTYEECVQQYSQSYEDYERERQAVVK